MHPETIYDDDDDDLDYTNDDTRQLRRYENINLSYVSFLLRVYQQYICNININHKYLNTV